MPSKRTIAHAAIVTPHRSGLYETVRELVAAERALGVDARIVDPKPHPTAGHHGPEDRGALLANLTWGAAADLIVSHSGHDGTPLADSQAPIVIAAHGRPQATWRLERDGGAPAYTYQVQRARQARYRACVTFWAQHEPFLRPIWAPKPVHTLTAPVDLAYWTPGPSTYDFAGRAGAVNVVMADPWVRHDHQVFPLLAAFNLFRSIRPDAKLHCYAVDTANTRGIAALSQMLGGALGVVQGWATDLRAVYRKADLVICPYGIATRSVREAMACGVPVVSAADVDPHDVESFALEMARKVDAQERAKTRKLAEARFDPSDTARELIQVVDLVMRTPRPVT